MLKDPNEVDEFGCTDKCESYLLLQSQNNSLTDVNKTEELTKQQYLPNYFEIMKHSDKVYMEQLQKLIKKQRMQENDFLKHQFCQSVKYVNCIFKHNNRLLFLEYRLGQYQMSVNVMFVPFESQNHLCTCISSTDHSDIYRVKNLGKLRAFKCMPFKQRKTQKSKYAQFHVAFKNAVTEYMLYFLGDLYQFGPKLYKDNFNLVVYKNCVQFEMEWCTQLKYMKINKQQLQLDLKIALVKMHSLKIIHFDIKPHNICFSPIRRKYVFIDFGLSSIIQSQFGNKIRTQFKGTYQYSSKKMQSIYLQGEIILDPYLSDAQSLKKTLQQDNLQIQTSQQDQTNQLQFPLNMIIKLKHLLWVEYFNVNIEKYYYYLTEIENLFTDFHKRKYDKQVFASYFENRQYSFQFQYYQEQFVSLLKSMNYNFPSRIIIEQILNQSQKQKFEQFEQTFTTDYIYLEARIQKKQQKSSQKYITSFIENRKKTLLTDTYIQEQQQALIRKNYHHPNFEEKWRQYFQKPVSALDYEEYLFNASEFLSLKNKVNREMKQLISKKVAFVLKIPESLKIQHLQQFVRRELFLYAIMGENQYRHKICANLIFPIVIFLTFKQSLLVDYMQKTLNFRCSWLLMMQIVFQWLRSIEWVKTNSLPFNTYVQIKHYLMLSLKNLAQNISSSQPQNATISNHLKIIDNIIIYYTRQNNQVLPASFNFLNYYKEDKGRFFGIKQRISGYEAVQKKMLIYLHFLILIQTLVYNKFYIYYSKMYHRLLYIYYFERQIQLYECQNYLNELNLLFHIFMKGKAWQLQKSLFKAKLFNNLQQMPQFVRYYNILKPKQYSQKHKKHIQKFLLDFEKQLRNHESSCEQNILKLANNLSTLRNNLILKSEFTKMYNLARQVNFFERIKTMRINFQKLALYQNQVQLDYIIINNIIILKSIKNQWRDEWNMVEDQFLEKDIAYYLSQVYHVKSMTVKFYIIKFLNSELLNILKRNQQYQIIFQYLLSSTIFLVKAGKFGGQVLQNIIKMISIYQFSSQAKLRDSLGQIIINLFLNFNHIYPYLIKLLDYPYAIGTVGYYLLESKSLFFSAFLSKFMQQLRIKLQEYGKSDGSLLIANRVKIEFVALFLVQTSKPKVMKIINSVPKSWLFFDTAKIEFLQAIKAEILYMITTSQNELLCFLVFPFLYQKNNFFDLPQKKQFLKMIAVCFNFMSRSLKRVLFLDYCTHFLRIYNFKNKRKIRNIFRKCLPFNYANEVPATLYSVDPIQKFINKSKVNQINNKKLQFGSLLQSFKQKLYNNNRPISQF